MKAVSVEKTFETSLQASWKLLIDIPNYPRFVPFITNATLVGPLEEGVVWHDTTNILWVTQRVAHHVKVVEKHQRLVFIVPVTGGEVREEFILQQAGKYTKVVMSVSIFFRLRLIEETVGRVLSKRFEHMLTKTLINIEAFLAEH